MRARRILSLFSIALIACSGNPEPEVQRSQTSTTAPPVPTPDEEPFVIPASPYKTADSAPADSVTDWAACMPFFDDQACNVVCWDVILAEIERKCKPKGKKAFDPKSRAKNFKYSFEEANMSIAGCGCGPQVIGKPPHEEEIAKDLAACEYKRGTGNADCAKAAREAREKDLDHVLQCPKRCAETTWDLRHKLDSELLIAGSSLERCEKASAIGDCNPVLAYTRSCERKRFDGSSRTDACPRYDELKTLATKKVAEFGATVPRTY